MKSQVVYKNIEVTVQSEHGKKAAEMIQQAAKRGTFFSVVFTKKDGSIREMNCRLGVKKLLKGGKRTLPDNYICVYEMSSDSHKSVDPERVISVNGVTL